MFPTRFRLILSKSGVTFHPKDKSFLDISVLFGPPRNIYKIKNMCLVMFYTFFMKVIGTEFVFIPFIQLPRHGRILSMNEVMISERSLYSEFQ